jgi:hypothetical protein
MFLLAVPWLLTANVAAIDDHGLLRGRDLQNLFKSSFPFNKVAKVAICHYDADLGKFEKKSVRKARLKKHIGKHGPPGETKHKDMTVKDANQLSGSKDCNCIDGYTGDGLNCIKTTQAPKGPKEVEICHYNPVLEKFQKKSVRKARLKKHIGKHGPPGETKHKDMTVEDANQLPGSKDCKCMDGYDGDGLNCVGITQYARDFISRAFIPGLQQEATDGVEIVNSDEGITYKVSANLTTHKSGIISLADAQHLVKSVSCNSGENDQASIVIEFRNDMLKQHDLNAMFPTDSVLVINKDFFGT